MKASIKLGLLMLASTFFQACKKEGNKIPTQKNITEKNSESARRLTNPITALPAVYVAGIDVNKFRPLIQNDLDLNPNKVGFIFFRGVDRQYLGNNDFTFVTEPNLSTQVQIAKLNGIPIGIYHRLIVTPATVTNPFTSAKAQAQILINAITAAGGLLPGMWPIVDIERKPNEAASELWNSLTPEKRMNFITTFNYEIEIKYGIKPLVYIQESFIQEFLTGSSNISQVQNITNYNSQLATLGRHLLWEVNIDGYPEVAFPFTTVSFSQISFGERAVNLRPVPLVDNPNPSEKKDQDIFYGNYGKLLNTAYKPTQLLFRKLDKGAIVARLQLQLKALNFYTGPIGIYKNALFDEATRLAVIRFQQAKGISADGIVGKITRDKLFGIN
jgi:GH25 family lysozyme M1 (1,4-beta-N-acetylmuramidase)